MDASEELRSLLSSIKKDEDAKRGDPSIQCPNGLEQQAAPFVKIKIKQEDIASSIDDKECDISCSEVKPLCRQDFDSCSLASQSVSKKMAKNAADTSNAVPRNLFVNKHFVKKEATDSGRLKSVTVSPPQKISRRAGDTSISSRPSTSKDVRLQCLQSELRHSVKKMVSPHPAHRNQKTKMSRAAHATAPSVQPQQKPRTFPKPPLPTNTLINLALKNSKSGRLTGHEIVFFICKHFPFYRYASEGWKKAIHQRLAVDNAFEKRNLRGCGKGVTWATHPDVKRKFEAEISQWVRSPPSGMLASLAHPAELVPLLMGRLENKTLSRTASIPRGDNTVSKPMKSLPSQTININRPTVMASPHTRGRYRPKISPQTSKSPSSAKGHLHTPGMAEAICKKASPRTAAAMVHPTLTRTHKGRQPYPARLTTARNSSQGNAKGAVQEVEKDSQSVTRTAENCGTGASRAWKRKSTDQGAEEGGEGGNSTAMKRKTYVAGPTQLFRQLISQDEKFYNFTKMSRESFEALLEITRDQYSKTDTNFRKAIPPEERLFITLRFLATGSSTKKLMEQLKVSRSLLREIVFTVCDAVCHSLKDTELPHLSQGVFKAVAENFYRKTKFPHCLGAIGFRAFYVKRYSSHSNNKHIILQGVSDADGNFISVDIIEMDEKTKGKILHSSAFGQAVLQEQLPIPTADKSLDGEEELQERLPYVFIAEENFTQQRILGTHSLKNQTQECRVFNTRLSRARQVVEFVFNTMETRWAVLRHPLLMNLANAYKIILTCCVLHNFLRNREGSGLAVKAPKIEQPIVLGKVYSGRSTMAAMKIRETFTQLLNTTLSIPSDHVTESSFSSDGDITQPKLSEKKDACIEGSGGCLPSLHSDSVAESSSSAFSDLRQPMPSEIEDVDKANNSSLPAKSASTMDDLTNFKQNSILVDLLTKSSTISSSSSHVKHNDIDIPPTVTVQLEKNEMMASLDMPSLSDVSTGSKEIPGVSCVSQLLINNSTDQTIEHTDTAQSSLQERVTLNLNPAVANDASQADVDVPKLTNSSNKISEDSLNPSSVRDDNQNENVDTNNVQSEDQIPKASIPAVVNDASQNVNITITSTSNSKVDKQLPTASADLSSEIDIFDKDESISASNTSNVCEEHVSSKSVQVCEESNVNHNVHTTNMLMNSIVYKDGVSHTTDTLSASGPCHDSCVIKAPTPSNNSVEEHISINTPNPLPVGGLVLNEDKEFLSGPSNTNTKIVTDLQQKTNPVKASNSIISEQLISGTSKSVVSTCESSATVSSLLSDTDTNPS